MRYKQGIIHLLLPIVIIALAVAFGVLYFKYDSFFQGSIITVGDNLPTPSPSPTPDIDSLPTSTSIENKIVFTKDPDRDVQGDIQAWIMNPNGTEQEKIDINNVRFIYKWLGNSNVIYSTFDSQGSFFIKDLSSNKEVKIEPIKHPKEEVVENPGLDGLESVAPDFSAFVFRTFFTEPCPTTTVQSSQVLSSGPCTPDPLPELPDGNYLYDVFSGEKTYLGNPIQIIRWDMPNQALYFIDREFQNAGLNKIDLNSKTITRIENATSFGYTTYPFFKSEKFIKLDSATGNEPGTDSFSKLIYIDKAANTESVIDQGDWAEIQTFISFSPDEKTVIYLRTSRAIGGRGATLGSLHKFEPDTGTTTQISPLTGNLSFSNKGIWVDNENYITLVDTIEFSNYYNSNNYLVNINTKTGITTRLNENDDVYRFTQL